MRLPFQVDFEFHSNGLVFYVEARGIKEWDEDERVFTSLSKLVVTDEFGTELNDNDDVYNEVKEHVLYSDEIDYCYATDSWDEEEIPYSL